MQIYLIDIQFVIAIVTAIVTTIVTAIVIATTTQFIFHSWVLVKLRSKIVKIFNE